MLRLTATRCLTIALALLSPLLVAGCRSTKNRTEPGASAMVDSLWRSGYGYNNPNPQRLREGKRPLNFDGSEASDCEANGNIGDEIAREATNAIAEPIITELAEFAVTLAALPILLAADQIDKRIKKREAVEYEKQRPHLTAANLRLSGNTRLNYQKLQDLGRLVAAQNAEQNAAESAAAVSHTEPPRDRNEPPKVTPANSETTTGTDSTSMLKHATFAQ